jgi:hypothetical protein
MPSARRHATALHRHPSQARPVWPPQPGYFALRRTRGGWRVPAQIVCDDGLWYAIIDGVPGNSHINPEHAPGVDTIWTSGLRLPEADFRYLEAVRAWAIDNDPSHPALHPFKSIDPMQLRPLMPRLAPVGRAS